MFLRICLIAKNIFFVGDIPNIYLEMSINFYIFNVRKQGELNG